MANRLYDKGRQKFLEGAVAWITDDIKVILADGADYTPVTTTDEFLVDVPVAARVSITPNLTGKTSTDGVADANDVLFNNVTGDESEFLVVYQDSGVEATSALIALYDTAVNLPITPNGGDIGVQWDSGANRLFKL